MYDGAAHGASNDQECGSGEKQKKRNCTTTLAKHVTSIYEIRSTTLEGKTTIRYSSQKSKSCLQASSIIFSMAIPFLLKREFNDEEERKFGGCPSFSCEGHFPLLPLLAKREIDARDERKYDRII